jgi:leucyl aminopeptidase
MQVEIHHSFHSSIDTLLIPLFQKDLATYLTIIAQKAEVSIERLIQDFKAEKKETFSFYSNSLASKVVLIGLGLQDDFSNEVLRLAIRSFIHKNKSKLTESIAVDLLTFSNIKDVINTSHIEAISIGFLLGFYEIAKFKSQYHLPQVALKNCLIYLDEQYKNIANYAVEKASIIAQAQLRVFRMVNLPPNHFTAEDFAKAVEASATLTGYNARILHKADIIKENLGALLAVNQGSSEPPTFSILEYKPDHAITSVGIVGKGITFDTGGLNLKTSGMHHMKCDMAGGAAVIGIMEVVTRLKLPIHVIGIVPATDNAISATAQMPSSIIHTYSGITVEVEDTDAEGRLIVGEAVAYMSKNFAPKTIIDLATLTGSCIIALGYKAAGLFTNNDELAESLTRASQRSNERVWRFPLWNDYAEQLKSDMADLKNIGGNQGGAITAAKFIERFVEKDIAWAHLDIAGVAYGDSEFAHHKSSTAYGVRLITEYLLSLCQ